MSQRPHAVEGWLLAGGQDLAGQNAGRLDRRTPSTLGTCSQVLAAQRVRLTCEQLTTEDLLLVCM